MFAAQNLLKSAKNTMAFCSVFVLDEDEVEIVGDDEEFDVCGDVPKRCHCFIRLVDLVEAIARPGSFAGNETLLG